ncbi:RNA/RNP complex-1-interacting phosphatase isoform 2-T2 [Cyanocitta cristata]
MAGRGASRVPERWTDYIPLGRRMPGTRFIAFKVPLKKSFDRNLLPEERFSPHDLIRKVKERKEELGLIIDLTYTRRYYGPEELPPTLRYSKILTMGHEIPNRRTILRFKYIVKRFLTDNKDNDKLIGVHCTHGLNRTGYLVCRYLIDVEGMEPNAAIELFNKSRGHAIERTNYIQDLQKRALRSCELKNLGSDLLRRKGGAAAKPQQQLLKPPQHRSGQPPPAVPRNPISTKKKQQPGSKAQAQPQELGQQHGALEQRQLEKLEQQKKLEQKQQRQLEKLEQQKKLEQKQQRQLEKLEQQKKLEQKQQRQLEKLEQQKKLEQKQQRQQKKLEQMQLENLEQRQQQKLEKLEQKQQQKLEQKQLKKLEKLEQRQQKLEQKQQKKLEQKQLEKLEQKQQKLEQRGYKKERKGLFIQAESVRPRGDGFKLPEDRDGWDIGKELFPGRVEKLEQKQQKLEQRQLEQKQQRQLEKLEQKQQRQQKQGYKKERKGLFIQAESVRPRGDGFKLPEDRDGWDIGKELFPGRVGRPWHRVPRAALAAPGSLAVPEARLDIGAGSSLGQWEVSLPMAELALGGL